MALAELTAYVHEFKESVDCPMLSDRTLAELMTSRQTPSRHTFGADQFKLTKETIEGCSITSEKMKQ